MESNYLALTIFEFLKKNFVNIAKESKYLFKRIVSKKMLYTHESNSILKFISEIFKNYISPIKIGATFQEYKAFSFSYQFSIINRIVYQSNSITNIKVAAFFILLKIRQKIAYTF